MGGRSLPRCYSAWESIPPLMLQRPHVRAWESIPPRVLAFRVLFRCDRVSPPRVTRRAKVNLLQYYYCICTINVHLQYIQIMTGAVRTSDPRHGGARQGRPSSTHQPFYLLLFPPFPFYFIIPLNRFIFYKFKIYTHISRMQTYLL